MDYRQKLQAYLDQEIRVIQSLDLDAVNSVINILEEARLSGRHIFICGNGGSAATASHYCCDFNKGVSETQEQKYHFECLNDNIPTMMAVANDISYDEIFAFPEKQNDAIRYSDPDLRIRQFRNVVNAMEYAKSIGGTTIAIVGYSGGRLREIADHCIHVQIDHMQIAEDLHMILDHMMMSVLSQQ